jgi:hypothetical protein
MTNSKLFSINTWKLKLNDLSGLCTETLDVARPVVPALGQPLLQVKFNALDTNTVTLRSLMNKTRSSLLTSSLKEIDGKINGLFAEIKRDIKAGEKSSNAVKSDAAKLLLQTVKPYWNVTSEHYASQSAQIEELFTRVNASPALVAALATLDLAGTWQQLIAADTEFNEIYDRRLEEDAATAAPAASSLRDTVVKDYEGFCLVLEQTLDAFPSPSLQTLFNESNELRKKYAAKRPAVTPPDSSQIK